MAKTRLKLARRNIHHPRRQKPNQSTLNTALLQSDGSSANQVSSTANSTEDGDTEAPPRMRDKVQQAQSIIESVSQGTISDQKRAIARAIKLIYPYEARNGQLQALHTLMFARQDMILIAKTSFGKSMIFQAPSIMLKGQVTIILLPLNQIGIEQSEKIAKLGGKPCFLSGDLINSMVLKDLRQGKYTHLLFSPELALGDRLRPIIIDRAKDWNKNRNLN